MFSLSSSAAKQSHEIAFQHLAYYQVAIAAWNHLILICFFLLIWPKHECTFFVILPQQYVFHVFHNVCLRQHLCNNSYNQKRVKYAHELCQDFGNHCMLNHYDISNLVDFKNNISNCVLRGKAVLLIVSLREHSIDPFIIIYVITWLWSLND